MTPFAGAEISSTLCLVAPARERTTPLLQRTAMLLTELAYAG